MKLRRSILNYLTAFVLLYITVFIGVFIMRSLKDMKNRDFLFVSLARGENGEKELCTPVRRKDSIRIQKIDVDAPLVFPQQGDEDLIDDLDRGVTHFPSSILPGEKGTAMFLGHSAPPGWPDLNYDKVFIHIDRLEKGDDVEIYFDNCRYDYEITDKEVVDEGGEIPPHLTNSEKSSIVLISCWPPSTGRRRMVVAAELQEPEPLDF